ncbi:hypothetical protein XbrCFBP1976_11520 [Xanthomonas bromi]|uniref:Uncharacterized protein n=1 Tax=Xanthomonas bromi TaxID=56449 RepID=A0ABX5BPC9_9XANT|nr:hypothetical protein XbrCFBP1976_11520 [Xanthomonas bromi]
MSPAGSQPCGEPRKKHTKTSSLIFGSVILLGAVTSASVGDFAQQRANVLRFWDQQVRCVDSFEWRATATCLGNVWNNDF